MSFQKKATFAVFLFPALALYLFFAVLPLLQGFWLSTTNWDGTAPWTPAQMPIAEFEDRIMNRIRSEADRVFLLKYYVRDEEQGTYRKLELYGLDRYRVQYIIGRTGYINPDFKNVGFGNYVDIFRGKIDKRFFPERYRESRFRSGDPIDSFLEISREEFEGNLLPHLKTPEDRDYIQGIYKLSGSAYALDRERIKQDELEIQIALSEIAGLKDDWEALFNDALAIGAENRRDALAGRMAGIPAIAAGTIAPADKAIMEESLGQAFELGRIKGILSRDWYLERQKMGVLLFTALFVVFNVILVNVLAMALALALDLKMKSRNALRSIFFIPNVLSMIIVAFIWQLVFTQLLPAITGVDQWMMNPDLAPWLTILVAVWQGVGYYTVIYLAGLQGIPQDIVESASIDGATASIRFFRIVLPLIVPAITISLFLSISGALKTFDIIFALYPSNSTSMGVDNITVNIFYDAFRDKHAGLATAKAILLLLTIMIITGTQLVLTKKREMEL
ncbi:MAG: sugar ABC transporter permease [Spirochaetes bacterium]|nr:sugar ABC transporter permease [Spirochaetota bacterium]